MTAQQTTETPQKGSMWRSQRDNRFASVPTRILRRMLNMSSDDPEDLQTPNGSESKESSWKAKRTNRFDFWPADLLKKLFK